MDCYRLDDMRWYRRFHCVGHWGYKFGPRPSDDYSGANCRSSDHPTAGGEADEKWSESLLITHQSISDSLRPDEERRRMARDLHDGTGQIVAAI
jgi:signal transduction histidine kinase